MVASSSPMVWRSGFRLQGDSALTASVPARIISGWTG